jgi:sugar O-acyltransferase (sialic acid O-acetyltransferase NeuD family)
MNIFPKKNIIIVGSSGHAKIVIDIIEKENKYKIIGLIDKPENYNKKILNYNIIGTDNDIPHIIKKHKLFGGIIAVGDNWTRYKVWEKIKSIKPNFNFVNAIHPSAQIAKNVRIGNGTVIMAGAIVNSDSSIGKHCIINTNSSLDHDSVMCDFSSLAPNSATGGNVQIGKFSAICLGANIIHGITIKEQSVIGAGSVVLKDIPEFSVFYGIPAKFIRQRQVGEKYL